MIRRSGRIPALPCLSAPHGAGHAAPTGRSLPSCPTTRHDSTSSRCLRLTGGVRALRETPRVIVGTIHSVKGCEADVVFLFPDLSRAADAAYQKHGPDRDSVIRLFYVDMTRAKHTLYICQQESASTVIVWRDRCCYWTCLMLENDGNLQSPTGGLRIESTDTAPASS